MKIKFHYSLVILLLIALLSGFFIKMAMLFTILLLHEFGHLIACRCYHRSVKNLTLLSFGGVIDFDDLTNTSLIEDLVIIFSGLFINIVIFIIGKIWVFNDTFLNLNLIVLFFNILPIWPLDGGRLIEIVFCKIFSFRKTMIVINQMSIVLTILMMIGSILVLNVNLLIVGFYLYMQNVCSLKQNKEKYEKFLLKKYLYPNGRLHRRLTNGVNDFYRGVNNVSYNHPIFISEYELLSRYFRQKHLKKW